MSALGASDNVSVFCSTGLRSRGRSRRGVACGLVEKLESAIGAPLRPGRNVWYGYPIDIDDQSPEGGLAVDAVDRDAASGLMKELRRRGFKVRRNTNTQLLIQASTQRSRAVACAGPSAEWFMMQGVKSRELAERAAQLVAQGVNPQQVLRQALDRQAGGYVTMSLPRRSRGVACGMDVYELTTITDSIEKVDVLLERAMTRSTSSQVVNILRQARRELTNTLRQTRAAFDR